MKTPMQEMLERVEEYRDSETSPLVVSRLNSIYVDLLGMLEKEKQQIMDAFEQGENNSVDYFNPENRIKESENYYIETFNTKER